MAEEQDQPRSDAGQTEDEYGTAVQKWLEEQWGKGEEDLRCAVCNNNDWTIGLGVAIDAEPGLAFGHALGVYQFVPLFCDHCGNTLFFNATAIGVIPDRPAEPSEDSPEAEGT